MGVQSVTDESFSKDVLESSTPVLVDFWAEWCGPCRQLAPIVDELAKEMGEKVKVVKINIDQSPEAPTKYGVRGIPTLMLFKAGQVTATKVGALPKSKLIEWVEQSIAA
jgi:thioredoxin 1